MIIMCACVCYTGQLHTNLVFKVMNTTNYMLLYIIKEVKERDIFSQMKSVKVL